MSLPMQYNAAATEAELNQIKALAANKLTAYPFIPLATAPSDPKVGWVAYSDGTGSGFDASSGEGLYIYKTGGWTFIA